MRQQHLKPNNRSREPRKKEDVIRLKPKSAWKKHLLTCVGAGVMVVVSAIIYEGYLETRIITPYSYNKLITASPDERMVWGTYRPGLYFGLKTREEHPLSTGLMWYFPKELRSLQNIRHFCEIGDRLDKYGWTHHDGRNFGVQEIKDGSVLLETSFIKGMSSLSNWVAKVNVASKNVSKSRDRISLIWYTAFESVDDGFLNVKHEKSQLPYIEATSLTRGRINFRFTYSGINSSPEISATCTSAHGMHKVKEAIAENLAVQRDGNTARYYLSNNGEKVACSIAAVLITFKIPGSITINMHRSDDPYGNEYSEDRYKQVLDQHQENFSKKFDRIFNLRSKGFKESDVVFAKSAMSNLIGSIGYFYGASKVQGERNQEPLTYWKAPLYTAVPSRSFFPRGFLWDEGFHGLLISTWDIDIALDIMMHWLDLMNVDGWIPREQILGSEALAKVPTEFVIQKSANANPPTFFLVLSYLLNNYESELKQQKRYESLTKAFPRIQAWYSWFNTTQLGDVSGSYRWKGRSVSEEELNPKTLTSGLDDYPRASHPDESERHVDLLCWMILASRVTADLATFLKKDDLKYRQTFHYLSDIKLIDHLHLSSSTNTYADYGMHTNNVVLEYVKINMEEHKIRRVLDDPEYQMVDGMFGYVSLFPFLIKILPNDHSSLGTILEHIRDPNVLWTDYGIASLSKKSPIYSEYNTKHDPPYWRGKIWININYMILGALHFYAEQSGPYQAFAQKIYNELRTNIIQNMIKQYQKTGYIWENYSDVSGDGTGCYPFTGWSALVVMIMAEIY